MAEVSSSGHSQRVPGASPAPFSALLVALALTVPTLGLVGSIPLASGPAGLPHAQLPMVIPNLPRGMSTFPVPPSSATFQIVSPNPTTQLSGQFWGADLRIFSPANSTVASAYNQTGLSFVRWPGGAVADDFNVTANRIYHYRGAYATPPTSIAQFASWCLSVRCQSIVQLPGEINSSSTGAYYVDYIENTVGFHPNYWEIGNEPALWHHFNVPWVNWTSTQRVKITPLGYAHVVQAYAAAIHSVDPSARILGLPGFGQGGYNEPTWIQDSVMVNGPNLSGVAIHVYPSGRGPAGTPSLSQFYRTLGGHGTLSYRIPRDRAAVAAGCGNCTNIPVFVSEMGAGSAGGSFTAFMKSYDNVPYIGTEVLQGIELNITNIDLFALQSRFPGSLLNMSFAYTPVGVLYSTFFTQLGRGILPITTTTLTPGVRLMVAEGATPSTLALLAISTNTSTAQIVRMQGSGFPTGPGTVIAWNASSAAPVSTFYNVTIPTSLVVPPRGILMVVSAPNQIGSPPPGDRAATHPGAPHLIPGREFGDGRSVVWSAAARPETPR